jgi:hypothetical protein
MNFFHRSRGQGLPSQEGQDLDHHSMGWYLKQMLQAQDELAQKPPSKLEKIAVVLGFVGVVAVLPHACRKAVNYELAHREALACEAQDAYPFSLDPRRPDAFKPVFVAAPGDPAQEPFGPKFWDAIGAAAVPTYPQDPSLQANP